MELVAPVSHIPTPEVQKKAATQVRLQMIKTDDSLWCCPTDRAGQRLVPAALFAFCMFTFQCSECQSYRFTGDVRIKIQPVNHLMIAYSFTDSK